MDLRVATILLISFQHLLAAENATITEQSLQIPALSTSFGNTTTRETETTEVQNVSNLATENLLILPNNSHQLNQKSLNLEQNEQNDLNFIRPTRGKTKFTFENIVHALSSNEVSRNETTNQDQSNNYYVDQQESEDLQRQQQQQLDLATVEKEEFIQTELHNLAKDIAETELNLEGGKTNSSPRPSSSWKSFFSNIFPQGILNVFHLSVSTESKKSNGIPTMPLRENITPQETNRNKRVLAEMSKLTIAPPSPIVPPSTIAPETPTPIVVSVSVTASETEAPQTVTPANVAVASEEKKSNGSVMTNKDVFDINSAAEVSQLPSEIVIPMESRNIFHIHPLNCEGNCGEETEDYVDQLSETGDDNIVAFSNESPRAIFYPTPKSLPYDGPNTIRNSEGYYSGTGTQTSEEIIRENTKDFGQKIPYHPAKQLDDFQKEVEKQFDHNEVRIDSEAASRKFLKHFKGKFVKPSQQLSSGQANNFKGINHFQLISSTLSPEVNFKSQPSPIKPESELHTYIYSAGFTSESRDTGPPKTGQNTEGKSPNSEIVFVPYPEVTPQTFAQAFNSVTNAVSEAPKPPANISPWITPNKKSDTKDSGKVNSNQMKTNNHLHTSIYSAGSSDDEAPPQSVKGDDSENNIQSQIKKEKPIEELFEAYSTNLRPESLLHTYVYSAHEKVLNNSLTESGGNRKPGADFPPWITPKPEKYSQGLSRPTQTTYLCTEDQLKNGDCSYSTTPATEIFNQPENLIEIQKSVEQQVRHTTPYVYYSYPPSGPPLLSKNPINVVQPEDSVQSESLVMPESYQQRQQYLQDHQKHLNQQQEYFQQHQIQQYQQKLLQQQQEQYQQKQLEQIKKQQELLQQYQQKQQQQMQQYQQVQQQQRDQQQQELQKQQMQQHQQLHQFQQVQQQQRDHQQMQKQQQQLQQYQQEQQTQRDQQHLLQLQKDQQQKQQQEHQQQYEKQQKLVRYNTVKVEKLVPKPYPVHIKEIVEKIVERPVPVDRIVEKPVNVPYPVREVVEKIVDRPYPVEKIVDRPVHIPYPVQVDHFIDRPYAVRVPVAVAVPVPVHQYIDRPYPVEKIVEKPIHVPYPVDKVVEKIVEKHIPVEVERIVEVEKPAPPKKPAAKKATVKTQAYPISPSEAAVDAHKNKSKLNLEDFLELVPPPVDEGDHDAYRTIPDDIEFILLDDYNRPIPFDNSQGYPWNKPEKRATSQKNHNIKRSPEFRRNLRVEYGFRPPLIPSVEIGEKGLL